MLFPRRSFITSFMKWMTVEGSVVNELFVEQFVLGMKNFRLRPYIRVLPATFTDEELREIESDTLLLIGGKEVIYDPEEAVKRAKQHIHSIEAEVVPNASHGLPMERPELVNECISSFLNQKQKVV